MTYITREAEKKIKQGARHFPVVVLTGARQVGKSTMLKAIFPDYHYVSLDRPLTALQAEEDPESFLKSNQAPLIIDEAQYAPGLFRHLKSYVDSEQPQKNGQYILTGSQKFNLMQEVVESLAGRAAIFELEGFSISEINSFTKWQGSLEEYYRLILQGGFPKLWIDEEMPVNLFFSSYTASYLERDVRQVLNVISLRDFERFMRACAIRSGGLLNRSELARDVGISVSTASEWLSILVALGQIVLLEPWFSNLNKRLSKTPKLYFADTGLACFLAGIDEATLPQSPLLGGLWESFVFSELRKQIAQSAKNLSLWYYRDQSQREVDFILQQGSNLTLIEAKWGVNPSSHDARHLHTVAEIFAQKSSNFSVTKRIIVSRSQENFTRKNGERVQPITAQFVD